MTTSSVDEPADLADEPRFFHEVPARPALLQPHDSVALSLPLTSGLAWCPDSGPGLSGRAGKGDDAPRARVSDAEHEPGAAALHVVCVGLGVR